jgi:hypothetical protein
MGIFNLKGKGWSEFTSSLGLFLVCQLLMSFIFVITITLLWPDWLDNLSDDITGIGTIALLFLLIRGANAWLVGWNWVSEHRREIKLHDWLEPLTAVGVFLFICIFILWVLVPSIDEVLFWPTSGVILVGLDVFFVGLLFLDLFAPTGEAVFMIAIFFMLASIVLVPTLPFVGFFLGYTMKISTIGKDRLIDRPISQYKSMTPERELLYKIMLLGYAGILFGFLFKDSETMTVLNQEITAQAPLIMIGMDIAGVVLLGALYILLRSMRE